MFRPRRPTGFDPKVAFDKATWDHLHGGLGRILPSTTVSVDRGTQGITLHAAPAGAGGGITPRLCKITTLYHTNYFGARPWNPMTEAYIGAEFKVARCLTGRMPEEETIDGEVIAYVYPTGYIPPDQTISMLDNFRTAFSTGSEYQVVHPRYTVGDLVVVLRVPSGTGISDQSEPGNDDSNLHGNQLRYLEMLPARFWAYQYGQSGNI